MNKNILELAETIWNYHLMNHKIEKSDIIFVLGSHDIRVAERGAELFQQGFADKIIFSGGTGRLTDSNKDFYNTTEAEKFSDYAISKGVPKESILIENKSTNTGENIQYSYEILKNMKTQKIILVQKPYMERRTFATFSKQWPQKNTTFSVTSPLISFGNYPNEEIGIENLVHLIVGDLQRIIEYPKKGFQIFQEVPENVLRAYNELIKLGFTKHMI